MPDKVQTFRLTGGEIVLVESTNVLVPTRERVADLPDIGGSFDAAWKRIEPAVKAVKDSLSKISPEGCEVKFGVKLSAEAGAIFTSGSAKANFEITLKWGK